MLIDGQINSIKSIYKMRQSATEHLLGLVNAKKVLPHEKNFTLNINGSFMSYSLHNISKEESKKTVPVNDLWHVNSMIDL